MRKLLASMALAIITQLAAAQTYEISGNITGMDGTALPFANTMLLRTDSTFVTGTTSDEQGHFTLQADKAGWYILKAQCIGYEDLFRDIDIQHNTRLDTLRLKAGSYQLDEVEVTGKTPMVRREADKLIFDPRNVAAATNAVDLLRVSPGIMIQGDNITMFSAQGVKFYINGKEQKMSSKEMLQVLRSYPAGDIDKIELITSPSAKYSAEGKAGVINLVLKKRENNFIGAARPTPTRNMTRRPTR